MCGINGIYAYHYAASAPRESELERTQAAQAARGPDGSGQWWNAARRMGFAHLRLAIQDLSERGAQPMHSASGRYVLNYNGEIYNAPALRRELEAGGSTFVSDCDAEVVLQLFERYGAASVKRLRGMFAFAIWDNEAEQLFLARDPYGIKPLYVADDGWTVRFASQVKALLAGGGVSDHPEPAGVTGFYLFGSVPEPYTLYRDIRALPAGHTQLIDKTGPKDPQPYFSLAEEIASRQIPAGDARADLKQALRESIDVHMLSDVPVGLFLSSGIDSCAVLGVLRDLGHDDVRCVTLAFDEFKGTAEDEAPLAAQVANYYGAAHSVYRVSKDEFAGDVANIVAAMDQPSIDGINTWFVAKAAKAAGLKVALSGLGGDELLGGYPSFTDLPRLVGGLRLPALVPGLGALAQALLTPFMKDRPKASGLIRYGGSWAGAYLLRRGLFLPEELRTFLDPETTRIGLRRLQPLVHLRQTLRPTPQGAHAKVTTLESSWYMRNQLLRDADWAGMAHSVEIRTPFVDSELLRQAAPAFATLRPGEGKALLAATPERALPPQIATRPKTGFSVPTGNWIKGGVATNKGLSSRAWAKEVCGQFQMTPSIGAA